MRTSTVAPASRIRELDGLRGIAILLVLATHYTGQAYRDAPYGITKYLFLIFRMGWCGVDLFFVLSGFLIGGILLDARDARQYFRPFYLRRVYRILPIYYLVVLVYGVLVYGGARYLAGGISVESPGAWYFPVYLLFVQNIWKVPRNAFGAEYLGPLWSLAVEEQFYLVIPLLIRFLPRRVLVWFMLLTLAGAPLIRVVLLHYGHAGSMYSLMPARADALALGILIAIGWRTTEVREWFSHHLTAVNSVRLVLFGFILCFAIFTPSIDTFAMAAAGFSVLAFFFGLALFSCLLNPKSRESGMLRSRVLRDFGLISYCLYLIHMPFQAVIHRCIHFYWANTTPAFEILIFLVILSIAWGVAHLSWRYWESPLLQRGKKYSF